LKLKHGIIGNMRWDRGKESKKWLNDLTLACHSKDILQDFVRLEMESCKYFDRLGSLSLKYPCWGFYVIYWRNTYSITHKKLTK
jgi:hypothetical protein